MGNSMNMKDTNEVVIEAMAAKIHALEKQLTDSRLEAERRDGERLLLNDYLYTVFSDRQNNRARIESFGELDAFITQQIENNPLDDAMIVGATIAFLKHSAGKLADCGERVEVAEFIDRLLAKYEAMQEACIDNESLASPDNSEPSVIMVGNAGVVNTTLVDAIHQANKEADRYYDLNELQSDNNDYLIRLLGGVLSLQDDSVIDHLAEDLQVELDCVTKNEPENYNKISALRSLCWLLGDSASEDAKSPYLEQQMMAIFTSTADIDKNMQDYVQALRKRLSKVVGNKKPVF